MSSTAEALCSHCKKHHSLASCPLLEEQQLQAYSQAETSAIVALAGMQASNASAAMQATDSDAARPVEGLSYNGNAYLCADTLNTISDNQNISHTVGSSSIAPPDPYANTYPTGSGSEDFASTVGNRFSWADHRSTSAGNLSEAKSTTRKGNKIGSNDSNNSFNFQRPSQHNESYGGPVKQESHWRLPSLPLFLARPSSGSSNNIGFNIKHPSQANGSSSNAIQPEFQTCLSSFDSAPTTRATSFSENDGYGHDADRDAASEHEGFSTSEYQERSSPARSGAPGLLPTPIRSFVPSGNHGQYLRPLGVLNDQRTLPGPYRYNGYANDPAANFTNQHQRSENGYAPRIHAEPLIVPQYHNLFNPDDYLFPDIVLRQASANVNQNNGNPNVSDIIGQRGNNPGQNVNLTVNDQVLHPGFQQNNYQVQAASPIQQSFNLRPMPSEPDMGDYTHTPTFAVESLKNYAKDLQSWAFELYLHTTRLENLTDLPGRLLWNRDSSFGARLILERTPANRELFDAAIAAGNSATKALIRTRNLIDSMNVSPPLPSNFLPAGQQPLGKFMETEHSTPDSTPVRGTSRGRGRGRGRASRGGRVAPAAKRAPAKRKSATQDTDDGDDMMGGDNTASSDAKPAVVKKAPARKRGPAKKVRGEPASDPADIPQHQPGSSSLPVPATDHSGMFDDRDLDAEGETDEEWFESQRRNTLGVN
ncbi:hypothetical protein BKA64DRAFT_743950 [Cadophora sp. MPI-SDFR-AT-0126]|nr:hypothetical protein BKA64DRAFT_743950 [Leotiomycetes sp. MPI-SDFR-AT-0126]